MLTSYNSLSQVLPQVGYRTLIFPFVPILTSVVTPQDLLTISVPADVARWIAVGAYVESNSSSGTMAATTVDIRTATGGGGSSILSGATALAALTGPNLAMGLTAASVGAVLTATTLTLRQSVASLFAGTISIVVLYVALP